jgi:hypothetical protein
VSGFGSFLGGAVGFGIGTLAGGPTAIQGFQIGAAAGGILEQILFRPPTPPAAKLSDLKITGSAYNSPIPRLWGRASVGGTIIHAIQVDAQGNHLKNKPARIKVAGPTKVGPFAVGKSKYVEEPRAYGSFAVAFVQGTLYFPDGGIKELGMQLVSLKFDGDVVYNSATGVNQKLCPDMSIEIYPGSDDQGIDGAIAADCAARGLIPTAHRGIAYVMLKNVPLHRWGDRIPGSITAEWRSAVGTQEAPAVIADLLRLSGIPPARIDVPAGLPTPWLGVVLESRSEIQGDLAGLLAVLGADLVELGGVVSVRERDAGAPDWTFTTGELGATTDGGGLPIAERNRGDAAEVPGGVEFAYVDGGSGANRYQAATASDVRQHWPNPQIERMSAPLVMLKYQAARIPARELDRRHREREAFVFSLPPSRMAVAPGDVALLPTDAGTVRVRLTQVGLAPFGEVRCRAVPDAGYQVVQAPPAGGGPAGGDEPIVEPVPCAFVAFSGVPLEADDATEPSVYVAASWGAAGSGGTIYWAADPAGPYVEGPQVGTRSAFGAAVGALGNGTAAEGWDDASAVLVDVSGSGAQLASASDQEVLAGDNLAILGGEVIGVGTATLAGAGIYELSHLRRGLAASAMTGHAPGERFAMLEAVERVGLPSGMAGQTAWVKVVAPGEPIADVTPVSVVVGTPPGDPVEAVLNTIVRPHFVVPVDVLAVTAGQVVYDWTEFDATDYVPAGAVAAIVQVFWSDDGANKTAALQVRTDAGGQPYDVMRIKIRDDPDSTGMVPYAMVPLKSNSAERSFQHRLVDGGISHDLRLTLIGYWG